LELWQASEEEVYQQLNTSPRGLTSAQAAELLKKFGPNVLKEKHRKPIIYRFFAQFKDLFAILLELAALLTFIAAFLSTGSDRSDNLHVAFAIIGVVILNAAIGFFQEFRAEKATEALQKLVPQNAKVIRDGELTVIPAADLVPGDIMALEEGDSISADARLVRQFEMATNNISLTGESDPVRKTADSITQEKLAKIEMPNLVFMGTSVATGNGRAVIFATGMDTEFGRIFELTSGLKEEKSPLQIEIGRMATTVSIIALGTGVLLFGMGKVLGLDWVGAVLFALGVMVACVPEGLPATLSVALAVGVQKMAKENALIKKLSAVETLGSTNVICTDKTGTLTKAEMTVKEIYTDMTQIDVMGAGYEPVGEFEIDGQVVPKSEIKRKLEVFFRAITFCNNSKLLKPDEEKGWRVIGDPTEGCLITAAEKADFPMTQEIMEHPRIYEIPFESIRKRMSVVTVEQDRQMAYIKGAPSETIRLCTKIMINGKVQPFTDDLRAKVDEQNDAMSRRALRVLAICEHPLPADMTEYPQDVVESDLTFLGLIGMIDPPRPEVSAAVKEAHSAGIRIVMITGDYGLTAEAIARKIGIVSGDNVRVVTGLELDAMSQDDLKKELVKHPDILFARVSPEHKMRVVLAFKDMGEVVAVTGDGVNDAPALKTADIGVAMGLTGTDVSREAAVMILLDDSFASIIKAVEYGRGVYANLKKMVTYLFSHNAGELFPFVFATLAGVHLVPLTALQVLSIDLGSDVLPSLALGTEPPEPGVMNRPPRPKTSRLMDGATLKRIAFLGTIQSIGSIVGFMYVLLSHHWHWGDASWAVATNANYIYYREAITMTQAGIVLSQFANGFVVRTEIASVFKVGLFSNRGVVLGELFGLLLMIGISYWHPLQELFKTAPLTWQDWLILIATAVTLFFGEELRKWVVRKRLAVSGCSR
jgi:magnesium-transporting ATPase (P-type)